MLGCYIYLIAPNKVSTEPIYKSNRRHGSLEYVFMYSFTFCVLNCLEGDHHASEITIDPSSIHSSRRSIAAPFSWQLDIEVLSNILVRQCPNTSEKLHSVRECLQESSCLQMEQASHVAMLRWCCRSLIGSNCFATLQRKIGIFYGTKKIDNFFHAYPSSAGSVVLIVRLPSSREPGYTTARIGYVAGRRPGQLTKAVGPGWSDGSHRHSPVGVTRRRASLRGRRVSFEPSAQPHANGRPDAIGRIMPSAQLVEGPTAG
jgi:hypothetical protein